MFAHRRVALAGGGGSGGRCGWKLRSREAGLALTHARKARRQAEPPNRPAKGRPSVGQHVFVIGHRVHIPTRFVGVVPCGNRRG